jgi:hypothetical protein
MIALKFMIVPVVIIFMTLLSPMTSFTPDKHQVFHNRPSTFAGDRHDRLWWGGSDCSAAKPPLLLSRKKTTTGRRSLLLVLYETPEGSSQDIDDNDGTTKKEIATTTTITKQSLQEKMKTWQASEQEIKAASLGGVIPKQQSTAERSDSFDVGLYVAFPFMIITCLLFLAFPFFADKIDVSSVGLPPMS